MLDRGKLKRRAAGVAHRVGGKTEAFAPRLGADRGTQISLVLEYQRRLRHGEPLPSLAEVEFRNYSQNGEDGILLFLFALAGMGDRRAVEICAGDGIQCNSANLVVHHGWDAVLVDGDEDLLAAGRRFYAAHPETNRVGPRLVQEWVTKDTVGDLLDRHGISDPPDLLSFDLDGMDYWIAAAVDVRPRVIVCEYNNRIPASESITVPYRHDFRAAGDRTFGAGYFGASLAAFDRLFSSRGYRLVGANRPNTNAFFLRGDVLADAVPAVEIEACLSSRWATTMRGRWWEELRELEWIAV